MSKYKATKKPIGHNHDGPPDTFLDTLIAWAKQERDAVFDVNNYADIYSLVKQELGPWLGLLHRKAVLCEVMRVVAGDESDWHFQEGRDTTAGAQRAEEMEAGAWQVSYDSRVLGADLQAFLVERGIVDAYEFQQRIKRDPDLDCAYTARLLREPYRRWDGPINRGWVEAQVSREAVAEFMQLLS